MSPLGRAAGQRPFDNNQQASDRERSPSSRESSLVRKKDNTGDGGSSSFAPPSEGIVQPVPEVTVCAGEGNMTDAAPSEPKTTLLDIIRLVASHSNIRQDFIQEPIGTTGGMRNINALSRLRLQNHAFRDVLHLQEFAADKISEFLGKAPAFWRNGARIRRAPDFVYGEGVKHKSISVRLEVIQKTDRPLTSGQLDKVLEDNDFRMLNAIARYRFQSLNSEQKNKLIDKVLGDEVSLAASFREEKTKETLSELLEQGAEFSAEQVDKILDTLRDHDIDDLIEQGLPLTRDQIDVVLAWNIAPERSLIESQVKGKRRAFTEEQLYRLNRDEYHSAILVEAGHLSEEEAKKYAEPQGVERQKKDMREKDLATCQAYIDNPAISHEIVREAVMNKKDENVRFALIRSGPEKRPLDKKSLDILLRIPGNADILNELSEHRGKELTDHNLVDVLLDRMIKLSKKSAYFINFRCVIQNKDIPLTSKRIDTLIDQIDEHHFYLYGKILRERADALSPEQKRALEQKM